MLEFAKRAKAPRRDLALVAQSPIAILYSRTQFCKPSWPTMLRLNGSRTP
jgi:hypothetical protein